jgi:hypothetical protein
MIQQTPLGRFRQPSDIAAVVLFLVSEDARWVTRQIIQISGGLFLMKRDLGQRIKTGGRSTPNHGGDVFDNYRNKMKHEMKQEDGILEVALIQAVGRSCSTATCMKP